MINIYYLLGWLVILASLLGWCTHLQGKPIWKSAFLAVFAFFVTTLVIAASLALIPLPKLTVKIRNRDHSLTYGEAIARFGEIAARECAYVLPECRSVLLQHGHATDRVVILLHGMNHSPKHFLHFSQLVFDTGANVLIPLAPFHGVTSRDRTDWIGNSQNLDGVTAEWLQKWGDNAVEIAQGLGQQIDVLGFSMGGTVALYLAGTYPYLNSVVAVAPGLLPKDLDHLTEFERDMFVNFFSRVHFQSYFSGYSKRPNVMYGYSWTCIAEIARLGRFVQSSLPPFSPVVLISNCLDDTVSNEQIDKYVQQNKVSPQNLFVFDETYQLPHDLIDWTRAPNIEHAVYPVLVAFLTRTLSSSSTQHT
jgi:esterase/lipase